MPKGTSFGWKRLKEITPKEAEYKASLETAKAPPPPVAQPEPVAVTAPVSTDGWNTGASNTGGWNTGVEATSGWSTGTNADGWSTGQPQQTDSTAWNTQMSS